MTLDISTDHQCFDGIQTVTLRKSDGTTDSVGYATRGPLPIARLAMIGGGMAPEAETVDFSLPASLCAFAPANGMTITDASSVVWRILDVTRKTFAARYSCACVRDNAAIAAALQPASFAAAVVTTSVTFSWRNPNHGTSVDWELQYSTSASFAGASTTTGTSSSASVSTQVTGLAADTTYYARVRHDGAAGTSSWSEVVSFTTSQ